MKAPWTLDILNVTCHTFVCNRYSTMTGPWNGIGFREALNSPDCEVCLSSFGTLN